MFLCEGGVDVTVWRKLAPDRRGRQLGHISCRGTGAGAGVGETEDRITRVAAHAGTKHVVIGTTRAAILWCDTGE